MGRRGGAADAFLHRAQDKHTHTHSPVCPCGSGQDESGAPHCAGRQSDWGARADLGRPNEKTVAPLVRLSRPSSFRSTRDRIRLPPSTRRASCVSLPKHTHTLTHALFPLPLMAFAPTRAGAPPRALHAPPRRPPRPLPPPHAAAGDAPPLDSGDGDDVPPPKRASRSRKAGGGSDAPPPPPRLEPRAASRLRSQLRRLVPDPDDDPLFDPGERGFLGFIIILSGD